MPSDDPYAKYLAPPPTPSGGDDPYAKYLSPPGATAATVQPGGTPPSFAKSDPATWALAGLDHLGMGLGTKNPFMEMPQGLKSDVAASHEALGWMDYPLAAAAYAVGPGKILGPAGRAIGGAGIGGVTAEGALAGGASSGIESGGDPMSIATGAVGGAALGGAAGALGAGASKLLSKPGSIDPAAAIAATKEARDKAYAPLKDIAFDPNDILGAHTSATLTPGMAADVSPGFKSMLAAQQKAINAGGNTANDIADYVTNIKAAGNSPGASNGDRLLAGQTADNLEGLLARGQPITGQAPGDAMNALTSARGAHQQYVMAQNLAEWQRRAAQGVPLGQAPFTEAENFYQGKPEYQTLVDLYKQGQDHPAGGWWLPHMAAGLAGDVGGMLLGFPGHFLGELAGYAGAKPALGKFTKGMQQSKLQRSLQQAYPSLTGQPLTGAQPASPQVGEWIKNLMLGSAY